MAASNVFMRQTMKFLHSLASCGVIGALVCYMLILVYGPQSTPAQYADMRQIINHICNYLLMPSLAVVLVTGLLSMVVHRPFQDKRWVWLKAMLGIGMFEATLAIIQSKANTAAAVSAKMATGEAPADALAVALSTEWSSIGAILAISIANIVLGVWRPKLQKREKRAVPSNPAAASS